MPRPALTPRLRDLDPEQVAAEVCADVIAQIDSLAEGLSPASVTISERVPHELARLSTLGRVISDLVRYAQGHEVLGNPVDEVQQVLGLGVTSVQQETAIGVALAAGSGRRKLEAGEALTVRELAALGGIADNALRLLARAGKIRATGRGQLMTFSPGVARAWLEKRRGA